MSEEIIPEVNASDVELASPELEEVALGEAVIENVQDEETPDYQSQSLSELVASLQEIASAEERMKLYKRVEDPSAERGIPPPAPEGKGNCPVAGGRACGRCRKSFPCN